MRRIFILIAAALSATLVYAQDAENVGNSAQLSIIPRIDLNPYVGFRSDAGTDFSLSNSSLYTLLEGNFGEHFSYSIMNHWLSEEPGSLYEDTFFHSDVVNWCDWANLTYSAGDFYVTLGKNPMALGLWEQDAYDYESHFDLNTTAWNNLQVYQWGGDFGYYFTEDMYGVLQLTSSPFSVKPFQYNIFSAGAMLRNDGGDFNYMASFNALGIGDGYFIKMVNAGGLYSFGDCVAGLDLSWHFDRSEGSFLNEASAAASFEYDPSDKLNLIFKAGYEDTLPISGALAVPLFCIPDHFFGGLAAHYFPLRDNDALRLHAVVAYDNGFDGLSINIGALYNISINIK